MAALLVVDFYTTRSQIISTLTDQIELFTTYKPTTSIPEDIAENVKSKLRHWLHSIDKFSERLPRTSPSLIMPHVFHQIAQVQLTLSWAIATFRESRFGPDTMQAMRDVKDRFEMIQGPECIELQFLGY